jgi:hypothetical protein
MHKHGFVFFFFCLFAIFSAGPGRPEDRELRTVLEGRYAALKSAMASRNENEIASLLSPDFASEDVSGKVQTASQTIQQVKGLPQDPNKVSKTTLLSIERSGGAVIAEQRYDMKTVKTGADGIKRDAGLITLSTDSWIIVDGTWLLQRTVTNQLDYSLDGQAIVHKVRAPGLQYALVSSPRLRLCGFSPRISTTHRS